MQILLACAKNMTTRPDQKLPAGRQCQTPRQRRPEHVRLLETSPDQCADRFRGMGGGSYLCRDSGGQGFLLDERNYRRSAFIRIADQWEKFYEDRKYLLRNPEEKI